MSNFVLSPDADEDVFQIWAYLFRRAGQELADRIESELYNSFQSLARTPGLGHRRPDLTDAPVLFYALYQYLIVYRTKNPLEIVRVIHGRRNVERMLKAK
jgi:plasmid stabilization system protein ParE